MKNGMKTFILVFLLSSVIAAPSLWAGNAQAAGNEDLKQERTDSGNRATVSEQKTGSDENPGNRLFQSVASRLQFSGGISAGYFYASNPGADESDNAFLLSNFIAELSSKDTRLPVGFTAAFGETSTPTLLSTPENNTHFDIEYGSLTLKPMRSMDLEVGLLRPNAGFEDTYTFHNMNALLGALASQQPYNAYGARLGYDVKGLHLCAGYYKKRLDPGEYNDNGSPAGDSWEAGVGGSISDYKYSLYHYHLEGLRNLTGVAVEHTIKNVYLAVDVDYWNWDTKMRGFYGSPSAIGGAFYVVPRFGRFSVPVRLEYIDQGESRIYIDNTEAKHIFTATITPTYRFCKKAYFRVESAYVKADHAFADKNGNTKSSRIYLAAEVGYLF